MKTNRSALWMVRIRGITLVLTLVGMVGVAFWLGESLAARFGQTTAPQTEGEQAPNVSLGDLIAAARSWKNL
jgi:flagellar basal body-associated protein FliL